MLICCLKEIDGSLGLLQEERKLRRYYAPNGGMDISITESLSVSVFQVVVLDLLKTVARARRIFCRSLALPHFTFGVAGRWVFVRQEAICRQMGMQASKSKLVSAVMIHEGFGVGGSVLAMSKYGLPGWLERR